MSLGYISRASGLRPAVVATMAMTLMTAHVDVVAVQKEERIHGNEIYMLFQVFSRVTSGS